MSRINLDVFEFIFVKSLFKIEKKIWFYSLALFFSYTVVGWLLTAFSASPVVRLGTLAVSLHLSASGTEAILLANAWVLIVILTLVLQKTWPLFLGGYIPYQNSRLWSVVMILFLFFGIALILIHGWTHKTFKKMGWNDRKILLRLVTLTWIALGLGWIIFQIPLLY